VHTEDKSFFTVAERNLLLLFVIDQLHITSHIGHVGAHSERSGLCLCRKEKCLWKYLYPYFFKEYKVL
jgi:hypothetical protein